MLNSADLAKKINEAIGATDKDGLPIKVTPEMETYAKAVLTITKASTFHLAGTVTGTTPPGSPLINGKAVNGKLLNFTPAPWVSQLLSGFAGSDPAALNKSASSSVTYINGAISINFKEGDITGTCTNTAEAPGPLLNGAGEKGKLEGLNGSDWAALVLPPLGDKALAEKIFNAIVKYLKENAEVSYAPGSVTGVCPPGGGSLSGGAATGGIIK